MNLLQFINALPPEVSHVEFISSFDRGIHSMSHCYTTDEKHYRPKTWCVDPPDEKNLYFFLDQEIETEGKGILVRDIKERQHILIFYILESINHEAIVLAMNTVNQSRHS